MVESRLLLNAAGMALPLFVQGNDWFAVSISGTWVGQISFFASQEPVNLVPVPVSLTPFPSGTPVSSATANGNFFAPVLDQLVFNMVMSKLTSGSAIVNVISSNDTSFQNAFLTPSSQWMHASAYESVCTLTAPAQTNQAWRLLTLIISSDATPTWAYSPALQIFDGLNLLWAMDPPRTKGSQQIPLPLGTNASGMAGITTTPGNALTVTLASSAGSLSSSSSSGPGGRTNIDAELSAC